MRYLRSMLALLLVLVSCLGSGTQAAAMGADTPEDLDTGAWYGTAAVYCWERGLLKTDENGRCYPDALLSKIELISLLSQALGLYDSGEEGLYTAKYKHFAAMEAEGILTVQQFPEQDWAKPVSRFEVAQLLYRIETLRGGYRGDGNEAWLDSAPDRREIPPVYRQAVNCVYRLGLMTGVDGTGTFQGWGGIRRGGGWVIAMRLLEQGARTVVQPPIQYAQLLARYTTSYDQPVPEDPALAEGRQGSIFNMNKAGEHIDGFVLAPGETFSYNRLVGNAVASEGYRLGIIVSGGRLALDYGGGVCQTSTTLFQAVLRANLTVVERSNHGLVSAYVPPGMDAAVYGPWKDFRFQNPYAAPIKIVFENDTDGRTITVKLYSAETIKVPLVELRTEDLGGGRYRLIRYADGVANYTAFSQYKR